ncbi:hypothetical protein K6Y31_19965 [Motilimonas cestriensis]|uniref:4Fe4S-binding SPASM domain-containing protein n=1 Tax=Motilimonas cestriensis TaxID=2742685 RepID=A0ABS8WDC9_9GAMM|nr:radical SAM/SPASM domain-containing protein [Motilimonas cestriensis]MCE2597054.1 hypothetical protein [Motilimonas cestriensis]
MATFNTTIDIKADLTVQDDMVSALCRLWQLERAALETELQLHFRGFKLLPPSDCAMVPFDKNKKHFFDGSQSLYSIWHNSSSIGVFAWLKNNGFDFMPQLFAGRILEDEERNYIDHRLESDYELFQLLRATNVPVKSILAWNNKGHIDEFKVGDLLRIYTRDAPHYQVNNCTTNPINNSAGEQLYCQNPFRDLILGQTDSFSCCSAWHGGQSFGDPSQSSMDELWHGDIANDFRASIIDGSYRYCRKDICPKLVNPEDNLRPFNALDEDIKQAIRLRSGAYSGKYRFLNCGYDYSCNLSCPSCRSELRIATGDEALRLQHIEEQIELTSSDLEEISISGSGDPFGSPFSRAFLNRMSEEKFPQLNVIYLHCNGQQFHAHTWEKLPLFVRERVSMVEISIDAALSDTYELNRRGGSFERLLNNLAFISNLRKNGYIGYLRFSFVVQKNNYIEMPLFVCLSKKYLADSCSFSRLINWGTYSNEDYQDRNIANSEHVLHDHFLSILSMPCFDESIVDMTNLR